MRQKKKKRDDFNESFLCKFLCGDNPQGMWGLNTAILYLLSRGRCWPNADVTISGLRLKNPILLRVTRSGLMRVRKIISARWTISKSCIFQKWDKIQELRSKYFFCYCHFSLFFHYNIFLISDVLFIYFCMILLWFPCLLLLLLLYNLTAA